MRHANVVTGINEVVWFPFNIVRMLSSDDSISPNMTEKRMYMCALHSHIEDVRI